MGRWVRMKKVRLDERWVGNQKEMWGRTRDWWTARTRGGERFVGRDLWVTRTRGGVSSQDKRWGGVRG